MPDFSIRALYCAGALLFALGAIVAQRQTFPSTARAGDVRPVAAPQPRRATGSLLTPPPRESLDVTDFGHPTVKSFDPASGAPASVREIAIDGDGYLWTVSGEGGFRYDGHRWLNVKMPDSTRSDQVRTIVASRDGSVWLVTPDAGVARYSDGSITAYDKTSGLPSDAVGAILETSDDDGAPTMWVGTNAGLACFHQGEWTTIQLRGEDRTVVMALAETMSGDRSRSLWVALLDGGVARYENGDWTYFDTSSGLPDSAVLKLLPSTASPDSLWAYTKSGFALFEAGRWMPIDTPKEWLGSACNCLLETVDGDHIPALWAGFDFGLVRFASGQWLDLNNDKVTNGLNITVNSLLETIEDDGTPVLWIGTGAGLERYRAGIWTWFQSSTPHAKEVYVRAIKETVAPDGTQVLWAGTDDGLMQLPLGPWTTLDRISGVNNGTLAAPQVLRIFEVANSGAAPDYWLLTGAGPVRFHQGVLSAIELASIPFAAEVTGAMAVTTKRDGSPTVCLATDAGLVRFDDPGWSMLPPSSDPNLANVLGIATVSGGNGPSPLWLRTHGGNLKYNNGVFEPVSDTEGPVATTTAEFNPGAELRSILAAVGGRPIRVSGDERAFYNATSGIELVAGANRRNGAQLFWRVTAKDVSSCAEDGQITAYGPETGRSRAIIMSAEIVGLAGGGHEIWIGTSYGGVQWLDPDDPSGRWKGLSDTTAPGLPDHWINEFCQDRQGRIYLLTNKGVARLTRRAPSADDPSEFSVESFSTEDGIPDMFCHSTMLDVQGRVWVGTPKGVAILDPAREVLNRSPDPLYVERARLEGADQGIAAGSTLSHHQNTVDFEFALLSYLREGDSRFRTQLVGFDDAPSAWVPESTRRYTNLPAGDYTLRVWGRDYAGNVAGPAEFAFAIRPAPWRTWWAYALYVLIVGALAYILMQYRLRGLRQRGVELEALVAQRTSELEASEHKATAANDAKSRFLASMSHELRTPLNAVLGFAQLMARRSGRTPEDHESLLVIKQSGEHLLGLINDVLSIAKIEAGRLTLSETVFDLHSLMHAMREMTRIRAEAKGLTVQFDVDATVPRWVRGDEGKLRQVLLNLVGNAVKFTDKGTVAVRASWASGVATIDVQDTGPGITGEEAALLFEAFGQTERGKRISEGTGLGLAISRQIIRLMGGDINVVDHSGEGATFKVEVPLHAADEVDVHAESRRAVGLEAGQPRFRILVADDTHENRLLLKRLLTETGFDVREAANGREAIEVWDSWRPDLIFMDIRMPVLDGREAMRLIREREPDSGATRIVALTASAFEHERDEVMACGANAFVTKPYRESQLFDVMAEQLNARFVYEEKGGPLEDAAVVLTAERFGSLPREDVAALARSLVDGDDLGAAAVAEKWLQSDAELARAVLEKLRGFDFEELLAVIRLSLDRQVKGPGVETR